MSMSNDLFTERDAVFPIAAYHMSAHEVKVLESVLNPLAEPDQTYFQSPVAMKAKQAYDAIPKAEAEAFKASTLLLRDEIGSPTKSH